MSKPTCSIEGCGRDHSARGWCSAHYRRWRRHGDPEAYACYPDAAQAFNAYTRQDGECIIWTGARNAQGYGVMGGRAKGSRLAHRYAWTVEHGPIPDGLFVDHVCHNPACVKIDHLRLATIAQNTMNRGGAQANHTSTGIRNVYPNHDRYMVRVHGKYGGTYDTIAQASRVAEMMRQQAFSEFAGRG